MAEGRSDGGRPMVGTEDRYAAGFGNFTVARECVLTLRFRSLGGRLAQEVGARRGGGRPLCGRRHPGISVSAGRGSLPKRIYGSDSLWLDWSYTQTRRAGSTSAGLTKRTGNAEWKGNPRRPTS